MGDIKTTIIVAMAANRCIGKDNKMPWHIPEDLKRFKALTMGCPVIMGRKTYESILGYLGKPLPGRMTIVISRAGFENTHNVPVFSDVSAAVDFAKSYGKQVFIVGGAQIYEQTIGLADRLELTLVHRDIEGDAFFPEFDQSVWTEVSRDDYSECNPSYSFVTLNKMTAP